jgi:fructosamine-3-kinase
MQRDSTLLQALAEAISSHDGRPFAAERADEVGGGCINRALVLSGGGEKYFVKLNAGHLLDMFEAEAAGLNEILASRSLRAPQPVCTGRAGSESFLVLEHLALGGHGSEAALGRGLAALHRATHGKFGWWRDNTIGSTPQINTQEADWVTFYREHRLRYQMELAADNGERRLLREGEALLVALPGFFAGYTPLPSLLHGDLWGGNRGALPDGTPVIFDPAVYYGDREADLAMTELFGGFGSGFYAAYNEAWPLDAGYPTRRTLYNLYHVLNHSNLFGGGYAGQAQHMIQSLLAEVR